MNGVQGPLGHTLTVAVHSEDERRNSIKIMPGQTFEDGLILIRLVESFAHALEVRCINGFETYKYPFATALGDQGDQFLIA